MGTTKTYLPKESFRGRYGESGSPIHRDVPIFFSRIVFITAMKYLIIELCCYLSLFLQGIGCTKITKAKNEGAMYGNVETRSYLEKKLVFCFGSHIAAQLLLPFGEENFLSSSELKQAQEVDTFLFILLLEV